MENFRSFAFASGFSVSKIYAILEEKISKKKISPRDCFPCRRPFVGFLIHITLWYLHKMTLFDIMLKKIEYLKICHIFYSFHFTPLLIFDTGGHINQLDTQIIFFTQRNLKSERDWKWNLRLKRVSTVKRKIKKGGKSGKIEKMVISVIHSFKKLLHFGNLLLYCCRRGESLRVKKISKISGTGKMS